MNKNYQICTRCIMDTSDPELEFDTEGVCNQCKQAEKKIIERTFKGNETGRVKELNRIINEIESNNNKNNKYDCIIGLSGGTDSSYLAYYIVKKLKFNPLAVHIDNGWNSELAVKNIENLVKKLNIDLYTYVIDWEEFKALQLAYLKASVIDLEVLSDNPIFVVISRIAKKHKIRYFFGGMNTTSESIMPRNWLFTHKNDPINIKAIYKRFGNGKKLKTYPILGLIEYFRYRKRVKIYSILDLINYNKEEAKKILAAEVNWRDYGGKHHESFITKFYQSYILPEKFNVDKRRAHLSSLIIAGQITREDALREMEKQFYKTTNEKENDINYFIKKLELTKKEFDEIMNLPIKKHLDYPSLISVIKKITRVKNKLIRN